MKFNPFRENNPLSLAIRGFLIGLGLLLFLWGFEIRRQGLSFLDLTWPIEIHQQTPVLIVLAFLPPLLAIVFYRMGRIKGHFSKATTKLKGEALKNADAAAREREWANSILDNAADCFITFEEGGNIIRFNKAAEALFQYKTEEVLHRQITTLLPELVQRTTITSEDWSHLMDEEEEAPEKGKVYETGREMKALLKDGTLLPCEVDLSRFIHGEKVTYTAIVRDITERKRNERLEKLLLQVTESVNQSQDLPTLYRSIHETLYQLVDASNFFIALTSADGAKHKVVYTIDVHQKAREIPAEVARGIITSVAEKKVPLLVTPEMQQDMSGTGRFGDWGDKLESWLGVPLIKENQLIGVIAVYSYMEGAPYSDKDVNIMAFLSTQIANALEREHNRELLRRNERRYRRIVEEAGETVYTCDLGLKFTYVNPPITRLTGYAEKELLNRELTLMVPDDWKENVAAKFRSQLDGRLREMSAQFPIVTRSGNTHWIEQTSTLQEENGSPVGYQAIVHDITERRAAERALREREERFRSLSASSPIGIFQVDTHDNCNYANKRFLEITGYEQEELVGGGWFGAIHPDDRETFRMEWIFAREEAGTHAREVRVLQKNQEIRWVNIRWTAITDENRKITGYVGTFEDITRRKHTERINSSLYKISQAAQNSTELNEFYAELHQCLSPIVDTTNFYIARFHHDRGTITFPYACENRVENLNLPEREVGRGLTGYVIRKARSLLAREQELNKLYETGEVELLGKPSKVWLGVPLISKQGVIGVVVLQSYTDENRYTESDLQTMGFVSSQIATAIERKQAEEETRRYMTELAEAHSRIKEDLRIAARIQQSRLPNEAPSFKGVEFSWLFNSCDEVAGDMFNFIPLDEHRVGIYILDVSGHGVPAALLSMTLSRSMSASPDGSGALVRLNGSGTRVATPSEVAETMNERYPMNLEINQYFTFIYGILDTRAKTFTFVRAGHPAPILVNGEGARELEGELGPAVGILPGVEFSEATVDLKPGDRILLFTDGVEEAANVDGEEFGVERTINILSQPHEPTVEADVQAVIEGVRKHIEDSGQHDDITIVGFRLLEEDKK